MRKLFGTDGVRGVANLDPMTSEIAMQLGRAAAHLFMRRAGRHQIVIGKDTRISGYMLESALTSGICSMGVDVLLVGPHADAGDCILDEESSSRCGGDDLSLAQSRTRITALSFFPMTDSNCPMRWKLVLRGSLSRTRLPI